MGISCLELELGDEFWKRVWVPISYSNHCATACCRVAVLCGRCHLFCQRV